MGFLVVQEEGIGYVVEKKSKFLAEVYHVNSVEEVRVLVEACKKKYFDAKHHCYAYSLGQNHEEIRAYDDGEPSGTAGRPILEVIQHENIHYVLIIVTRYFGGTLLGMGGLSRAYQAAAKDALEHTKLAKQELGQMMKVTMDYTFYGKAKHMMTNLQVVIKEVQYLEDVVMTLIVPLDRLTELETQLINESGGQVKFKKLEQTTYIIEES